MRVIFEQELDNTRDIALYARTISGTPKIEVKFDIGPNCILTVTAIDKGTNKQQSIRIEGAVTLSPNEKAGLRNIKDIGAVNLNVYAQMGGLA